MNDPSEPATFTARPIDRPNGRGRFVSPAGAALAAGWLLVPAIQYYATVERTRYQVGEGGDPSSAPATVEWDLTPLYLALFVLTMLHFVRAHMGRRTDSATQAGATQPGGAA